MDEFTAKMIEASVKRAMTTPMPIVIFASHFLFVAKNRIIPMITIVFPKGIPNDKGIFSLLSVCGRAG
jgi:hypothetical protein